MKYLIIMWAIGFFLALSIFFIEINLIPKLSDENSFKRWWRKNIVGVYNGSDF